MKTAAILLSSGRTKYFLQALESIFSQTHQPTRILVIHDTDNPPNVNIKRKIESYIIPNDLGRKGWTYAFSSLK